MEYVGIEEACTNLPELLKRLECSKAIEEFRNVASTLKLGTFAEGMQWRKDGLKQ